MPITSPEIERYLDDLLPPRDPLLAEVEAHAQQHRLPIVGPSEGRFLYTLVRGFGAKRILELGACSGYSALWLAAACEPLGGTVTTIELDPERQRITQGHFDRSAARDRLTLLRGNALEILPTLEHGAYDLIFNDLLRSGAGSSGVLLSDNVLCGGEVVSPSVGSVGAAIAEYNKRLMTHPELETSIVPIRDGVAISLKR
jgi:caffeoyl-CoA O-methyltransferase